MANLNHLVQFLSCSVPAFAPISPSARASTQARSDYAVAPLSHGHGVGAILLQAQCGSATPMEQHISYTVLYWQRGAMGPQRHRDTQRQHRDNEETPQHKNRD